MKIIKLPFESKIKCGCGCEFEFDTNDIVITEIYNLNINVTLKEMFIYCPICKEKHIIRKVNND